jgi:hypothetical protein
MLRSLAWLLATAVTAAGCGCAKGADSTLTAVERAWRLRRCFTNEDFGGETNVDDALDVLAAVPALDVLLKEEDCCSGSVSLEEALSTKFKSLFLESSELDDGTNSCMFRHRPTTAVEDFAELLSEDDEEDDDVGFVVFAAVSAPRLRNEVSLDAKVDGCPDCGAESEPNAE